MAVGGEERAGWQITMVMLVSLDQLKDHLRIDHDEEDLDLELKIHAASGIVVNYLKSAADSYFDSSGNVQTDSNSEPNVPFEVKASVLLMAGILFRERDGDSVVKWQQGYLPMSVTALLYPLRDPALV